jgi:hypothetical protein
MVKSKRIEHCRTDLLYWIHYVIDVTGFLAWCLAGTFGIYFSGVLRSIVCGIDHLIIMTGRPFRSIVELKVQQLGHGGEIQLDGHTSKEIKSKEELFQNLFQAF